MARQVNRIGRPTFSRSSKAPAKQNMWPRPKKSKKGWIKLVIVAAVVLGLWRYFAIERIEIGNADTLDDKAIELAVRKGMRSQLFGENLITLSSGRLEQSVTAEIPEVRDLTVERKWPTVLRVTIEEREPSLAWKSGGILYLLDRDGTVIREISSKKARVAAVTDTTNLPVKIGSKAVPQRFVEFTIAAIKELSGVGGGIKELKVIDTTSELHADLKDGYSVRLDTAREAGSQVASLRLVLGNLSKQGKRPAEYVDLRVEGKVYYK